jgi:hypothetical protein
MEPPSTRERTYAMNDDTTTLDQFNEDILTYAVSDEALEVAVGTTGWGVSPPLSMHHIPCSNADIQ